MTRVAGRGLAEQFPIGTYFVIEGRDHAIWRVTDVGTRVIVAIKHTPGWMEGPPFALGEHVFDEDDQLVMRRVEAT